MEIRPLLPDLFLKQLEERDEAGVRRSLDHASERTDGWQHLVAGMRRFTPLHEPSPGDLPAVVVVDAVTDLAPTYETRPSREFLAAASAYLLSLPTSPQRMERFDPDPEAGPPSFVPISILEEAVATGDADRTARALGALARAIRSKEYLLELLLETVAHDPSEEGRLLVQAGATVKLLHHSEWEGSRGLALRLVDAMSAAALKPGPPVRVLPPPVPARAAFAATLDREAVPDRTWLVLAHAFQAGRYAQVRPKAVRWGLRRWIATRLFGGDEEVMDREESRLAALLEGRPAVVHRETVPEEVGQAIARGIAWGQAGAASRAAEFAASLPDPDPLFRWIADATLEPLAAGDPFPIVTVNAARWGAHLVGPARAGVLVERLVAWLVARPPSRDRVAGE